MILYILILDSFNIIRVHLVTGSQFSSDCRILKTLFLVRAGGLGNPTPTWVVTSFSPYGFPAFPVTISMTMILAQAMMDVVLRPSSLTHDHPS